MTSPTTGGITLSEIHTTLELLSARIENSFSELSNELSTFRLEIQADIKEMKQTISEQGKSLDAVWGRSEEAERKIEEMGDVQRGMHEEISLLKQELRDQKEKNIALEAYTRRENLIFRNVFETADDDPKKVILNMLRIDLEIDTSEMRFHAIHRIGKSRSGIARPIIVRFVCREDKDTVFSKRKLLKDSFGHDKVYITLDYPKEIQKERAILIKAMKKAQSAGTRAKVLGRSLVMDSGTYNVDTIPEAYKD